MFIYDPPSEPPSDAWLEYTLPLLCQNRIFEICKDIIKHGQNTQYQEVYDAIYEIIQPEMLKEEISGYDS